MSLLRLSHADWSASVAAGTLWVRHALYSHCQGTRRRYKTRHIVQRQSPAPAVQIQPVNCRPQSAVCGILPADSYVGYESHIRMELAAQGWVGDRWSSVAYRWSSGENKAQGDQFQTPETLATRKISCHCERALQQFEICRWMHHIYTLQACTATGSNTEACYPYHF